MEKEFQMIKDAIADVANLRKVWQDRTRPMIMARLRNVNQVLNTQIKIEVLENVKNYESILFKIGNSKSGLIRNLGSSLPAGDIIVDVGTLMFSITFHGNLLVAWRGIYIQDIVGDDDFKIMGSYDVAQISEDDIDNIVRMFFLKIAMMYKGLDPDKIEDTV